MFPPRRHTGGPKQTPIYRLLSKYADRAAKMLGQIAGMLLSIKTAGVCANLHPFMDIQQLG